MYHLSLSVSFVILAALLCLKSASGFSTIIIIIIGIYSYS